MNDPHVQLYYEERKTKERQAKWNVFGGFAGLILMLLVLLTPVMRWRNKKSHRIFPRRTGGETNAARG